MGIDQVNPAKLLLFVTPIKRLSIHPGYFGVTVLSRPLEVLLSVLVVQVLPIVHLLVPSVILIL